MLTAPAAEQQQQQREPVCALSFVFAGHCQLHQWKIPEGFVVSATNVTCLADLLL
jgi:hypothetical protein